MKGISVGMAFALVFAVIFIGFILFFGTGMIADLMCIGNDAQTMKSMSDLKASVDSLYQSSDSGSSRTFLLKLPADSKMCFFNPNDPKVNRIKGWPPNKDIYDIVTYSSEKNNIWLIMCSNKRGAGYKIEKLSARENFCAEAGDKLYLENMGSYIAVSG